MEIIAHRYILQEELGAGGMGIVFKAYDRLQDQVVALKRFMVNESLQYDDDYRLAQEFQTLATLRHPHIISVLDYGFDDGYPFYVMECLPTPQTILAASRVLLADERYHLFIQLLQGITYLHRRGVLHRDIKPDNVLVTAGRMVKVLDFGLAITHEHSKVDIAPAGTLEYVAPEVLMEEAPSTASDLYAVGVLAHQILTGQHPFPASTNWELVTRTLNEVPDMGVLEQAVDNPAVVDVVRHLLAREPDDRYRDAQTVIIDLSEALKRPLPMETKLIRESFLQAATFVGRDDELRTLQIASQRTRQAPGEAWLIGGESGIGKTRLLDELRIRVLVDGALVLRGYAVEDGGLPYQLWRDVVRRLLLTAPLDDLEAGVLKEIVPDIARIRDRAVPDAPVLQGSAQQQRLILTITNLFRRQAQPVVLLLEDLQWAGESLAVLQHINQFLADYSLLIVGTYRQDETPDLSEQLPAMQVMQLERLDTGSVTVLAELMIGVSTVHSELSEMLHQQTEGNMFFLVEVIRALAEETGRLARIPDADLPNSVLTQGIQSLLQRRIGRVPADYRQMLDLVAVAGRYLELDLLTLLFGRTASAFSLDEWLLTCANAAVLDFADGSWRFSHDKLREIVLIAVDDDARPALHRQVAESLETLHPDDNAYVEILFNHWRAANDREKVMHYFDGYADNQVQIQARYDDLIADSQALLAMLPANHPGRGICYYHLSRAYNLKAAFQQAMDAAQKALETANSRREEARYLYIMGTITQQRDYREAQTYTQRSLSIYREINDLKGIATALNGLGSTAIHLGNYDEAYDILSESLELREELQDRVGMAMTLGNLALIFQVKGDLDQAIEYHERSLQMRREIGDKFGIGVSVSNLGAALQAKKLYEECEVYKREFLEIMQEIGHQYGIAAAYINLGTLAQDRQQYPQALDYYDQSISVSEKIGNQSLVAMSLSHSGFIHLANGHADKAREVWLKGLKAAIESQALTFVAGLLVGFARLRLLSGDHAGSVRITSFVRAYPSTTDEVKQGVLADLLAALAQEIGEETRDAALDSVPELELDTIVQEVLAEFDRSS